MILVIGLFLYDNEFAEQDYPAFGATERKFRADAHALSDPLDRIGHPGIAMADLLPQLQLHRCRDGRAKALIVGEMVEDAASGHVVTRDDLVDRYGIDGLGGQQIETRRNQGGACALPRSI